MEARYKPNKVVSSSFAKKPKGELVVKRKTLGQNLRPPTEKKRDLPPLTPLHRLQRFKAIRDRNLKNKLKQTLSHNILTKKMEQAASETMTESVAAKKIEEQEIASLKSGPITSQEKVDVKEHNDQMTNGQNGHLSGDEKLSNGHKHAEVKNGTEENGAKDYFYNESNNSTEAAGNSKEKEVEEERSEQIDTITNEGHPITQEVKEENEKTRESDAESASSSSTFTSKNFLHSSSEEMLEALQDHGENSEDEEIDVDKVSSTEDETASVNTKSEEEVFIEEKKVKKGEESVESKKREIPSRIPLLRSVGSASSYKTAYGSLPKISGRRPVASRGRKRPADSDSSDPRDSPSQPSPRWRFFQSSVSRLWSPSDLAVGPCSTPLRTMDDSMAVNVNEETLNCHLNDPDLFSEVKGNTPPSKRSRWGCSVM